MWLHVLGCSLGPHRAFTCTEFTGCEVVAVLIAKHMSSSLSGKFDLGTVLHWRGWGGRLVADIMTSFAGHMTGRCII